MFAEHDFKFFFSFKSMGSVPTQAGFKLRPDPGVVHTAAIPAAREVEGLL